MIVQTGHNMLQEVTHKSKHLPQTVRISTFWLLFTGKNVCLQWRDFISLKLTELIPQTWRFHSSGVINNIITCFVIFGSLNFTDAFPFCNLCWAQVAGSCRQPSPWSWAKQRATIQGLSEIDSVRKVFQCHHQIYWQKLVQEVNDPSVKKKSLRVTL